MRVLSIISLFFFTNVAFAQQEQTNLFHLEGALYGGLPIHISIHDSDEINGFSRYGSGKEVEYKIEGEKTDDGYTLYEFDENQALSGIIELHNDKRQGVWNSINFKTNTPISFVKKENHVTFDYVSHQSYIVGSLPDVDEVFEEKIQNKISSIMNNLKEAYGVLEIEKGSNSPSNRFVHRTIAVNKIALDSEDLISGHLTFYNNQSSDVATLIYTYDKDKQEMLGLSKIFKKNFNYSFFLKQYIAQKKEKMQALMTSLESSWLSESSFHNYVLTNSGLKFFSDYSTVFGQKSFTIPYHEVSSSIGQKSIANYIKNRK